MAIPLDTSPNDGSDKRVDEVVGSAFGGGPYITQSGVAERCFEPTNMVSQRRYGEASVGARWPLFDSSRVACRVVGGRAKMARSLFIMAKA